MKTKPTSPLWVTVARILLLILLAVVVTNWGYFVKQVSSWVWYDMLGREPKIEVLSGQPDQLEIQSIGLKAPLVYVDETNEVIFQRGLEKGVVHYPKTALPGELGNAYYFGHSSDYVFKKGEYKTVFATLPKVEVGDKVYITNRAGKQYVYEVIEEKIVEARDISVLSQGDKKQRLLTLQTSWPLGTALKRYLVICKLVD